MQALGRTRNYHYRSDATAISRDGSTIVGMSTGFDTEDAFVWAQATGLTALHGIGDGSARAFGVNATGSVVVGSCRAGQAVYWKNGQGYDLGSLDVIGSLQANAVSDDGGVIVGTGYAADGSARAFVWTSGSGIMLLSDYVASFGIVTPSSWRFGDASSVSADGRTIAGSGSFLDGHRVGYVVTIPAPSSGVALFVIGLPSLSRGHRRR